MIDFLTKGFLIRVILNLYLLVTWEKNYICQIWKTIFYCYNLEVIVRSVRISFAFERCQENYMAYKYVFYSDNC